LTRHFAVSQFEYQSTIKKLT